MNARYWGIITLVAWTIGSWSMYFLNRSYGDKLLNAVIFITIILISIYTIGMYLREFDDEVIDKLKEENSALKKELKGKDGEGDQ